MIRLLALLLTTWCATAAIAAPGLIAGTLNEFSVELPADLRKIAGRGKPSPITNARITIAVPANFEPAQVWPVLVVSTTTDPGYNSSRALLRAYAETAAAAGWMVVAADPAEKPTVEQDTVSLRLALNAAALAVLERQWPGGGKAPLAFGGFSGGSKISGWLAAAFFSEGRTIIGVYQAGINQNSLVPAATLYDVLNASFKRIPVFLQGGLKDRVSTPAEHQDVLAELKAAGFKNVRLEYFAGAHDVDPAPLRLALDWFRELAAVPFTAK
jgi:predicted esterase